MSGQMDFTDPGIPAWQKHSKTSKAAAVQAVPQAATQRQRVYELLTLYPDGLTDEQIQVNLDMNPSTERPRRIELVKTGRVVDSGETRKTTSGRLAVVWRVA